jgi:co-chaperonin GroES (HSP10)
VLPVEEKEEEDVHRIVLPDDYNIPQSPYVVCDVVAKAMSCEIDINVGDRILIERRMLHQINVDGETIYIVLQNYVYGRIHHEDN